jgi:hypothetical protein
MFMYGYPERGFSILFPQLYGKCQGKTSTARILPNFCVVLCTVRFVSFFVLFVCVYMCTVLLPPGGYLIAVNKYEAWANMNYNLFIVQRCIEVR